MPNEKDKLLLPSAKSKAYTEIRRRILECIYKPGTWLNEDILCEELGLSRTPVRDALSRLEQDGLIVIYPKKGSYITEFSIGTINAIYETRFLIEPFVLLNYGVKLDEGTLLSYLNRFNQLKEDEFYIKSGENIDVDDDFHWFIVSAAKNQFLQKTYQSIQSQNRRLRFFAHRLESGRLGDSYAEHIAIIMACLKHNWEEAAQSMRIHLNRSKDSTFHLFLKNGGLI